LIFIAWKYYPTQLVIDLAQILDSYTVFISDQLVSLILQSPPMTKSTLFYYYVLFISELGYLIVISINTRVGSSLITLYRSRILLISRSAVINFNSLISTI
jgi:hypothetical protein